MWLGGKDTTNEHAYKSVDLFEWEDGSPFDYLTQFDMQDGVEPTTADYLAMWEGNGGTAGTAASWAAYASATLCKCWACMTANTNINLTYTNNSSTIAMGMQVSVAGTTIPSSSPNKTVSGGGDNTWVYLTYIYSKAETKIYL